MLSCDHSCDSRGLPRYKKVGGLGQAKIVKPWFVQMRNPYVKRNEAEMVMGKGFQ